MVVWTIGHSTRTAEMFADLLHAHAIRLVIDVRRYPASRRHPQFGQETLRADLARHNIDYLHLPDLGGRRNPKPDSVNVAWKDRGFRGYADYMQTNAFTAALEQLIHTAQRQPSAVMCAEASWNSCHRGLIADALKVRGIEVIHIIDGSRTEAHPYTKPARVESGTLTYAAPEPGQRRLEL